MIIQAAVPGLRLGEFSQIIVEKESNETPNLLWQQLTFRLRIVRSIGWKHSDVEAVSLDEYEKSKESKQSYELVLTRQEREQLLVEWGATFHEIIEAIRANVKAKNQRRRTINSIGTYDRWEEVIENAGRKIKQTLLLKPKDPWDKAPSLPSPGGESTVSRVTERTKVFNAEAKQQHSQSQSSVDPADSSAIIFQDSSTRKDSPPRKPTKSYSSYSEQSESHDEEKSDMSSYMSYELCSYAGATSLPSTIEITEDKLKNLDNVKPPTSFSIDVGRVSAQTSMSNLTCHQSSYASDADGNFEFLTRDCSFWEIRAGQHDSPQIQRKVTPLIINEDYAEFDYGFAPTVHSGYGNFQPMIQSIPTSGFPPIQHTASITAYNPLHGNNSQAVIAPYSSDNRYNPNDGFEHCLSPPPNSTIFISKWE